MKLKENMQSDFDELLKEDGIYEDANDIAIKRVIAFQLAQEMEAQSITKTKMAVSSPAFLEITSTFEATINTE